MTGQLQLSGDGPVASCVECGAVAAGPCASCHAPLCADCCVITRGAKAWAVCPRCARGGSSLRSGWLAVVAWVCIPIALLAGLTLLLEALWR